MTFTTRSEHPTNQKSPPRATTPRGPSLIPFFPFPFCPMFFFSVISSTQEKGKIHLFLSDLSCSTFFFSSSSIQSPLFTKAPLDLPIFFFGKILTSRGENPEGKRLRSQPAVSLFPLPFQKVPFFFHLFPSLTLSLLLLLPSFLSFPFLSS